MLTELFEQGNDGNGISGAENGSKHEGGDPGPVIGEYESCNEGRQEAAEKKPWPCQDYCLTDGLPKGVDVHYKRRFENQRGEEDEKHEVWVNVGNLSVVLKK